MTTPVDQTTSGRLVFEDSIEVPASIGEVYTRWTEFTQFPDFMENVQSVQPIGGNRYHWIARIFGIKQEWDAEVIDEQPNSRVSWRSISGPQNQGTVSFSQLGGGNTEVRLRMEYTPPGGKTGQVLDQATKTTKREVHEDLRNFRRLFTGGWAAEESLGLDEPRTSGGLGEMLGKFAIPAAALVGGGTAAYYIEKARAESRPPLKPASHIEPAARTAGWVLTALSAGSIVASARLRSQNRKKDSLFVGQWAPTLLEYGIFSRIAGYKDIQPPLVVAAASYGMAAASLASILTSLGIHARGRRTDGLFVGQWAPTFMGGAILTRLIGALL